MDAQQRPRPSGRGPSPSLRFKITIRSCVALPVMAARGWSEVAGDYDWDIFWCGERASPTQFSGCRTCVLLAAEEQRSEQSRAAGRTCTRSPPTRASTTRGCRTTSGSTTSRAMLS